MDTILGAIHQALGATGLEVTAATLSLAYLVLAMRRSLWCWVCAFISSAIYVVVFARSGLPMDALLSIYYVVMAVYGYVEWIKGKREDGKMQIVQWTIKQHAVAMVTVLLLSTISGQLLQWMAPSLASLSTNLGFGYVQVVRSPWLDSFVMWSSVLTTWMVARRVLENWLYWIVIDAVAAALYWSRDLKFTTGLFVIYVLLCVDGYSRWKKAVAVAEPAT